jgi:preprotein translocase subunit YajC
MKGSDMLFQLLAQGEPAAPPSAGQAIWTFIQSFGFIIVIFVVMYFLIIHPQRKKDKERNEMRKSLKRNDKIITVGGVHGVVKSVSDDDVVILVDEAKDVKLKVSRQSIFTVLERSGDESEK